MRFLVGKIIAAGALLLAIGAIAAAQTPKEGDPAPNIEVPAAGIDKAIAGKKDGDKLSLKDFQGKKNVVLFFYPKAMTKG
jgi:peroxiredoxin